MSVPSWGIEPGRDRDQARKAGFAMAPTVDIEWGGENVHIRHLTDTTEVELTLSVEQAAGLVPVLRWAVQESMRYQQHQLNGGETLDFDCRPKPGQSAVDAVALLWPDVVDESGTARTSIERGVADVEAGCVHRLDWPTEGDI